MLLKVSSQLGVRGEMLMVEGSAAILAGDVVQKPMLVDDRMRPSELIREWLSTCIPHHEQCGKLFSGAAFSEDWPFETYGSDVQPSRLIKIFETGDEITQLNPRLIERGCEEFTRDWCPGRYAVLSHCWGPPDKRPLRTTEATLPQHLLQIPWQQLPQTFQDSMLLCRELSIQYIWIDSLCIIQDDEEDWRKESARMGYIYERALFTIAASSAVNSREGLFQVRKALNLVTIPYGDDKGGGNQVLAYIEPDVEKCLSSCPLNQRAWVMQEYFLSRRTVHFTTHGIIWSCKNGKTPKTRLMTSEFGVSWEKVFEDDWSALVYNYTRRELTYKSDKLVAIHGLSNQFWRRDNADALGYHYGLWLEDMPHDLLWYGEERLARDVGTGIPCWSWASTTGPISFKASMFENAEVFNVEITGYSPECPLKIGALVRQIDNLEGPVQCQAFCFEDLQDMGFSGRMHEDYKNGNIHVAPTFILLSGEEKVGWGVFDEYEKPTRDVFCIPLIKQKVWDGFALSKEQYFLWILLVTFPRNQDDKVKVLRGKKNYYKNKQQKKHVGHEKHEKREGYVRVGWGLHFVPSWFDGFTAKNISLE
jgi:Heterokaryon incompatibility protein (HET)